MKLLYRILILLFFLNANYTYAQICNCKFFDELIKQNLHDSVIAAKLIENESKVCKAKGLCLKGIISIDAGKLKEAEDFLKQAETLYKKLACSDSLLIDVYGNLSDIYYRNGNYSLAQDYSLKLLHAAEMSNNVYQLAISNTMVAQLFFEINQTDKAIKYIQVAASLIEKVTNKAEKKMLLYSLYKRYLWHYDKVKSNKSLDSAALYCNKLLALSKQTSDSNNISRSFNGLQEVEYEQGNLNKALVYLDSAARYINKNNYPDLRILYSDKADILLLQKKYTEALLYADSSLALDKFTGNSADMADSYLLFTKIYKAMNDYKKAFEYNELSRSIFDSINNDRNTANVTELEKKYNQEKNELAISDLQKKKQLYLLLSVLALFGIAIATLIYRQKTLKQKKNALEIEQRLNRARMNPHFFFNSLTALQKFALKENNNLTLASNLSKYSKLMRATLESTYKEYNTIEDEIEFLKEYLQLQQLRFNNPFNYHILFDDNVEIDDVLIPSMIIQPFLENTIEHGFDNINYTGNIEIKFTQNKSSLQIEISDNGKGINENKSNAVHISRATQIVKDRIYLLNLKHKSAASFNLQNNTRQTGATVTILLPLLFKDSV